MARTMDSRLDWYWLNPSHTYNVLFNRRDHISNSPTCWTLTRQNTTRLCLLDWLHTHAHAHAHLCVGCLAYIHIRIRICINVTNMKEVCAIILYSMCESERAWNRDKPLESAKRNDHTMINCYQADRLYNIVAAQAQHPCLEITFMHKHANTLTEALDIHAHIQTKQHMAV